MALKASYKDYVTENGEDIDRNLGINLEKTRANDPLELWKLWVLANFYQRVSEATSEKRFREISNDSLIFNPQRIHFLTKKSPCLFLRDHTSIHLCDWKNSSRVCKFNHKQCVVQLLSGTLRKHPHYKKISKTLIASSVFLSAFDYSLFKLYQHYRAETTNVLKGFCGNINGEKIPSLFLVWMSNQNLFGSWKLDPNLFFPIDLNIRRVCYSLFSIREQSQILNKISSLRKRLNLDNRVIELGLLNVGQKYCRKNEKLCSSCFFSSNGDVRYG